MSLNHFVIKSNLTWVIFSANIHPFKVPEFKTNKFLIYRRNSAKLKLLVSFLKLVLVSSVLVASSDRQPGQTLDFSISIYNTDW